MNFVSLRLHRDAEVRQLRSEYGGLLRLRYAPLRLGVSFPTIKQRIYKNEDSRPSDCEDIIVIRQGGVAVCWPLDEIVSRSDDPLGDCITQLDFFNCSTELFLAETGSH